MLGFILGSLIRETAILKSGRSSNSFPDLVSVEIENGCPHEL